jgi:trans-aconitate methyltransferase
MIPKWDSFYKTTKNRPPRQELLKALLYVKAPGTAIDIGAGALNESRYLLSQGFEVTAIDSEPAVANEARTITGEKFHFKPVSYEQFSYPKHHFDLVVALYALPFIPPAYFNHVVSDVLGSVKPGGVFVGHMFGKQDEWNDGQSQANFVSEAAAKNFFKDFDILDWQEEKGPGQTSDGETKFWHVYHIIAKRS